MTKILVLKGDSYHAVAAMFIEQGYEATFDYKDDFDVICFTGGADVSPHIYGEENTGQSYCDEVRDTYECEVFEAAFAKNIPMVGICRGGQLLNCLNDGTMIQHVGNITGFSTVETQDDRSLLMRIDHHQGIVAPSEIDGYVSEAWLTLPNGDTIDYAGYFPDTKCLIFQPHPEWGHEGTKDYFFELFDRYILPELGMLEAA